MTATDSRTERSRADAPSDSDLDRFERALWTIGKTLFSPARTAVGEQSCLDRSAYFLLRALEAHGPTRVSDVAAALHLDVSTVSRQLRLLEETGLIQRRPDPGDGRAVRLEVSPAGAAMLAESRVAKHEVLARAMAMLPDREASVLIGALEDLAVALSSDTDDDGERPPLRPETRTP